MTKCLAVVAMAVAAQALAGQDPAAATTAPAPSPQAATPKPAALGLFVYPAGGQDAARQAADEDECYAWARQQTGIDPTAAPKPVAAAETPKGGAIKGAAGGAAVGTAIGAIAGDTGEGAAIGAVAGAAKGRRAQKKAAKQVEQQAQQATQAQHAQTQDTFKKAWGACLEGRGYSVK
jgi:hypothetical protein